MSRFGIRKMVKAGLKKVLGREEEGRDYVYAEAPPADPPVPVNVPLPVPDPAEPTTVAPPEPVASEPEPEPVAAAPEPEPEPAPEAAAAAPAASLSEAERSVVKVRVVEALHTIFDPEIPVNIYELGLIYDVDVQESGKVDVRMTLTSPNCPAAQSLPGEVEVKSAGVDGATSAEVDIVWDPPWDPSMMSEAAQLELNMF